MRFCRLLFLVVALSFGQCALAEDLWQIYQLAVANDPTIQAAYAAMLVNRQALPEAIAQMAPNLSANYTTSGNDSTVLSFQHYNTQNYSLNLSQPIYHPEHWAQLDQARHIVKGANAAYLSATQELMIRVAQAYFEVLQSIDIHNFTVGQLKAFSRELEQTQQRFDVGLIAITDVQDAKARHDQAVAEEIAAKNDVADKYERLREITGIPIQEVTLFPVSKPLPLLPPSPNDMEAWVASANEYNLDIITAKENAEQFKSAIGLQVAGHYPKVDLQGQLARSKGSPPPPFNRSNASRNITLNVSVPLFAGGGVYFRTKEASERYQEALKNYEAQVRVTDSTTRQTFRNVLTTISSVKALAQVVVSNKSALDATQASYDVGTRTIVDVLDAQTNLLSAERDHAIQRYNYLFQGLRLKQVAGTLKAEDICAVNNIITGKNQNA